MFPSVPKVVFVNKTIFFTRANVIQGIAAFVIIIGVRIIGRQAVNIPFVAKLMQVAVSPTHDHLQDTMEVEECDISWNFKPSPNGGPAIAKGHLELVDGICVSFSLLYGRNHPAMKKRESPSVNLLYRVGRDSMYQSQREQFRKTMAPKRMERRGSMGGLWSRIVRGENPK